MAYTKLKFKVVSCPSKNLVYDNCLFISKEDKKLICDNTKHLKFNNGAIYTFKAFREMEKGTIGMSKISRQACKANTGDIIEACTYVLPQDENFNLVFARFNIQSLTGKLSISETDLNNMIEEKLKEDILSIGNKYIFDMHGSGSVAVTVDVLKTADPASKKNEECLLIVEKGVITQHTFVELTSVDKKMTQIANDKKVDSNRISIFGPQWKYSDMGIGGLDSEFTNIFRRAFASRTLPPNIIKKLGIEHVKGLLLHGPPGTGKTLIARQIGKMLHGKEPKIVNGPEILNKYVGQSEENIRDLFVDAELDYSKHKEESDLHIIIFDEIDAICKQRGSIRGGTGTNDSVVNQLLSKMDGVDSLNNILIIGMTNRKDLIDDALLRPGRFEVHVEIGLPDLKGRIEILKIHTRSMREHGLLGKDVDLNEIADRTKNFSGAEIAGLVKSATSFAYYGNLNIQDEELKIKNSNEIKINRDAFNEALKEVESAFGVSNNSLRSFMRGGIIIYSSEFENLLNSCTKMLDKLQKENKTTLLTILIEGQNHTGKTALAAYLAKKAHFPFTKIISPENFVGWTDSSKSMQIRNEFENAYRSPLSLIILDSIERLIDFVDIGPRFSNVTLQTLLVLLKQQPPIDPKTNKSRKLCVIGTTAFAQVHKEMGLEDAFMSKKRLRKLKAKDCSKIILEIGSKTKNIVLDKIFNFIGDKTLPIKILILILEMALDDKGEQIDFDRFVESAANFGFVKDFG